MLRILFLKNQVLVNDEGLEICQTWNQIQNLQYGMEMLYHWLQSSESIFSSHCFFFLFGEQTFIVINKLLNKPPWHQMTSSRYESIGSFPRIQSFQIKPWKESERARQRMLLFIDERCGCDFPLCHSHQNLGLQLLKFRDNLILKSMWKGACGLWLITSWIKIASTHLDLCLASSSMSNCIQFCCCQGATSSIATQWMCELTP